MPAMMTVYEELNYCNNIGEISVLGEVIWRGFKENARAYGLYHKMIIIRNGKEGCLNY